MNSKFIAVIQAIIVTTSIFCTSCQSPLYSWGRYEATVQEMYNKNGSEFDLNKGIATLAKEINKTTAQGKKVPPGKYAYLGYLYYLAGDKEAARNLFESEKTIFPESSRFMDYLLTRL